MHSVCAHVYVLHLWTQTKTAVWKHISSTFTYFGINPRIHIYRHTHTWELITTREHAHTDRQTDRQTHTHTHTHVLVDATHVGFILACTQEHVQLVHHNMYLCTTTCICMLVWRKINTHSYTQEHIRAQKPKSRFTHPCIHLFRVNTGHVCTIHFMA